MNFMKVMRDKNLRGEQTHQEPLPLDLPEQSADMPDEVKVWAASQIRRGQELTYFRTHSAELENDIKLANERIRMLESELNFIRDDRDRLQTQLASILRSFRNIKVLIMDSEADARAEAYAPPGSGTEPGPERPLDAADEAGLQALAMLTPKGENQ